MPVDDRDEGFLNRWSRRKAEARQGAASPAAEVPAPEGAPEAPQPAPAEPRLEDLPDEEILERLGLPDPDALEPGQDVSGFMAKAVPERLRRRALRRLWLANPALANLDELVDYGEDFTDAALVVENLQTAYQVGRGFMRDEDYADPDAEAEDLAEVAEGEADAEADAEAETRTEAATRPEDAEADAPEPATGEPDARRAPAEPEQTTAAPPEDAALRPGTNPDQTAAPAKTEQETVLRRRMRFAVAEQKT